MYDKRVYYTSGNNGQLYAADLKIRGISAVLCKVQLTITVVCHSDNLFHFRRSLFGTLSFVAYTGAAAAA